MLSFCFKVWTCDFPFLIKSLLFRKNLLFSNETFRKNLLISLMILLIRWWNLLKCTLQSSFTIWLFKTLGEWFSTTHVQSVSLSQALLSESGLLEIKRASITRLLFMRHLCRSGHPRIITRKTLELHCHIAIMPCANILILFYPIFLWFLYQIFDCF